MRGFGELFGEKILREKINKYQLISELNKLKYVLKI